MKNYVRKISYLVLFLEFSRILSMSAFASSPSPEQERSLLRKTVDKISSLSGVDGIISGHEKLKTLCAETLDELNNPFQKSPVAGKILDSLATSKTQVTPADTSLELSHQDTLPPSEILQTLVQTPKESQPTSTRSIETFVPTSVISILESFEPYSDYRSNRDSNWYPIDRSIKLKRAWKKRTFKKRVGSFASVQEAEIRNAVNRIDRAMGELKTNLSLPPNEIESLRSEILDDFKFIGLHIAHSFETWLPNINGIKDAVKKAGKHGVALTLTAITSWISIPIGMVVAFIYGLGWLITNLRQLPVSNAADVDKYLAVDPRTYKPVVDLHEFTIRELMKRPNIVGNGGAEVETQMRQFLYGIVEHETENHPVYQSVLKHVLFNAKLAHEAFNAVPSPRSLPEKVASRTVETAEESLHRIRSIIRTGIDAWIPRDPHQNEGRR